MKKNVMILTGILACMVLAGCSSQKDATSPQTTTETTTTEDTKTTDAKDTVSDTDNSEKGGSNFTPTKSLEDLKNIENDGLRVNYSEGYIERAKIQMTRLQGMKNYYAETKDITISTTINLLDKTDLAAIEGNGIPYGMPFIKPNDDGTSNIFLPATQEGVIIDATLKFVDMLPEDTKKLFEEAGYTNEDAIKTFVDLVGLHEVGHSVAFAYDMAKYPRWFNEFMATYFAYAYMVEKDPALAKVWMGNASIAYLDGSTPEYTKLAEFIERGPGGMTSANYDWFQKQFTILVSRIYDVKGLNFGEEVQKALTEDNYTLEELLTVLDTITPAFTDWANEVDSQYSN